MARLTIEQVAAPDLSVTSQILANAGASFDSGMESAKGLLGKYQEGVATKNDNAILNDIAKLGSEEELNAYLASDALLGKSFSPDMQKTILGLRKGVLGFGQDRANIDSTVSATDRLNAAEGRTNADWVDSNNARTELRGLTGEVVDATVSGRRYGNGGTPNEREILAATLQAEAGGEGYDGMLAAGSVIRNRASSGKYGGNTIEGVIMKPGQFSAWNGVTGYAGGEGAIDMGSLQVGDEAYAAADAILSGQYEDKTGGATHYYNPGVASPAWGKDNNPSGSGSWVTIGNHVFGSPDGGGGVSASGPVQGYDGSKDQSTDPLADAIKKSLYLTPDQALGLLQTGYDAQETGQTALDAAERKRVDELIATSAITSIQDPNNLSGLDVTQDMLKLNVSSEDRLLAVEKAKGLADGSLSGILAPPVSADPLVTAAMAAARDESGRAAGMNPSLAADDMAQQFEESGDIAGALIEASGGLNEGSGLDSNYVQKQIERLASSFGVSNSEMAATIADMNKSGVQLEDILIGNDPRIDAAVAERAQALFGDEARQTTADLRIEMDKTEASRSAAELKLSTAESRAAKMPEGSSERLKAEGEIATLKDTLLVQKTPQELDQMFSDYVKSSGMASRLQGLSPDDPDFTRAMMQLEEVIRVDKSLSGGEKELLIKKLRG